MKKRMITTLAIFFLLISGGGAFAAEIEVNDEVLIEEVEAVEEVTEEEVTEEEVTEEEVTEEEVTEEEVTEEEVTEEEVQEVEETAGVLPDSPFYELERAIENLILSITQSEVKLAELQSKYAVERAAESAVMTEAGEQDLADIATQEYMESIAAATTHLNNAIEAKDEAVEILAMVKEASINSENILREVLEKAPEDSKVAIEEALLNQNKTLAAVEGFHATKAAFFSIKDQLTEARNELKIAKKSGDQSAIELAQAKVKELELQKDEMEDLKDVVETSKEEVKQLSENVEDAIDQSYEELNKVNKKIIKIEDTEEKVIEEKPLEIKAIEQKESKNIEEKSVKAKEKVEEKKKDKNEKETKTNKDLNNDEEEIDEEDVEADEENQD